VRDKEAVFNAINSIPEEFKNIDILLNNAGNAHGMSKIQDGNIDDWDAMMDGNVKGLLYVTKAVLPTMIANNSGFIVNIGSVAAKEVYPNGNVYCASKHAVDALSKSMRIDLAGHNIRVSAIHPGAVETEFSEVRFKGDKEKADTVYQGFDALQAQDIAEIIEFVTSRPSHVNIEDLVVYPTAQANTTTLVKN
jgi:NADP-dependent 3-hydroxy acid dehydrogenase YdfG